jgi:phage gpG-like protein
VVEKEAKAEIGHYQGAAGPFSAWPELADATKEDRLKSGFSENDPLLRTGELRDSIEHTAGVDEAVVGSNSDIAVYQELGTQHIPPRSFLGGAAVRKGEEVANILGRHVVKALAGGSSKIAIPPPP